MTWLFCAWLTRYFFCFKGEDTDLAKKKRILDVVKLRWIKCTYAKILFIVKYLIMFNALLVTKRAKGERWLRDSFWRIRDALFFLLNPRGVGTHQSWHYLINLCSTPLCSPLSLSKREKKVCKCSCALKLHDFFFCFIFFAKIYMRSVVIFLQRFSFQMVFITFSTFSPPFPCLEEAGNYSVSFYSSFPQKCQAQMGRSISIRQNKTSTETEKSLENPLLIKIIISIVQNSF